MRIVIYKDKRKEWRWKLLARNGQIVAESGEGYKRKTSLYKALRGICNAPWYEDGKIMAS